MLNTKWLLPILLMLLVTPFTPVLDLNIEHFFFNDGHFVSNAFTDFMYNYGVWPGNLAITASLGIFLVSFVSKKWKEYRNPALLFLLTMSIGAGVIVHGVLKDHWGRPRPKQTIEFGGDQPFRPYYAPNFSNPEPSKSFSCGHCTMGFGFFALALAARRLNKRKLYIASLVTAIVLGVLLSITRMAQGGHYLSDVLMSALVMYLTALTVEWLLWPEPFEAFELQ